ncbi:hypothetical protein KGQ64_10080 [bacterium]|nr:hypothetical protein [bacterium]
MTRALAVAALVALVLGWVLLPRRPAVEAPDVAQDMGDFGPVPDGYRIGRTNHFIH